MIKETYIHYECNYCGYNFTLDITWSSYSHIKAADTCPRCKDHNLRQLKHREGKSDIYGYNYEKLDD